MSDEADNTTASAGEPRLDRYGIALICIAVVGFALRFIGLDWGLPYDMHPDEPLILERAAQMSWGNLNPGWFIYPGFFIYQMFLLSQVVFGLGGESADMVYAARLVTAAYSFATIGFMYLLGTRIGGKMLGTVSAGFVALMGTLTLHAHYAVTDTPATALITAVLWLSVRGWQRHSYRDLVVAAVVAGLAVSTKYSAAPVCFVPWVAYMGLAAKDGMPLARRASATALLAAAAIGAFLITSPYTVLDYQGFARDMGIEAQLQAEARPGQHVDPLENPAFSDRGIIANAGAMIDDMGPGTFLLMLASIVLLATGLKSEVLQVDRFAGVLIVLWVLLYYAFMAPSAIGGQRYVLPLYPAAMLLAAIPPAALLVRDRQRGYRPGVVLAVSVLIVAISTPLQHAASTRDLAQRDTRLVGRDWVLDNVEPGSHLAREFYAPPFNSGDGFRLSQPFSLTDHPLETYCAENVDYLLLSSLNRDRYFERDDPRFADERAWYDRLDSRSRIAHRVEGIGDYELHHPTIEVRRLFCGAGDPAP